MPIPKTYRVNPLDLQKTIAIGVSLPFNGPSGPFNSTYSTKEQIKSNLLNLILTNKGERVFNPEFGADIKRVIFEGITLETDEYIRDLITDNVRFFIPEVQLRTILVDHNEDNQSLTITINYSLTLSGEADQIIVEFI